MTESHQFRLNMIEDLRNLPNRLGKDMKRCSKLLLIRDMQNKTQGNTTICLLEYPKLRRLNMPGVGKDLEQVELL